MIKFNCLGLFKNQCDSKSFYRVTAHFGNKMIEFGLPDWSKTTSTVWCFDQSHQDLLMDISQCELDHKSCIIYKIHKYDCYTRVTDSNYAFAVQPLT